MHPEDPLPIDVTRLEPGAMVADIVVGSPELGTPLIVAAAAQGNPTHRGIKMLEAQMPVALELLGISPATSAIG